VRKRLALLFVLAAGSLAIGFAHVPNAVSAPASAAKSCSAGYVHAKLSWGEKCLRAGEFCKVANREYSKFGFYCPATGHLKRR
jgi:hypothetical protein